MRKSKAALKQSAMCLCIGPLDEQRSKNRDENIGEQEFFVRALCVFFSFSSYPFFVNTLLLIEPVVFNLDAMMRAVVRSVCVFFSFVLFFSSLDSQFAEKPTGLRAQTQTQYTPTE